MPECFLSSCSNDARSICTRYFSFRFSSVKRFFSFSSSPSTPRRPSNSDRRKATLAGGKVREDEEGGAGEEEGSAREGREGRGKCSAERSGSGWCVSAMMG